MPTDIATEQTASEIVSAQPDPTATPETPDTPETPETPEEDDVKAAEDVAVAAAEEVKSRAYAELTAKRHALNARESTLVDREQSAEEKIKEVIQFEAAKKDAFDNPIKLLESVGLSYEDLTNFILNDDKPAEETVVKKLQKQIADLQESLKTDKSTEEAKRIKDEQAYIDERVTNYKVNLNAFIDGNPDDYELVIAYEAQDTVWEVIEEYWHKHNKMLEPAAAAELVENHLLVQAQKLLSAKKLSGSGKAEEGTPERKKPVRKTLTNKNTAAAASTAEDGNHLDRDDSISALAEKMRKLNLTK